MIKQLLVVTLSAIALSACLPNKQADTASEQPGAMQADEYREVAAALQAGGSAMCTITKADGTTDMQYYAKADKVRVTGITEQMEGSEYSAMLMDGEYIYTWNETTKEGVKFAVPDPAEVTEAQQNMPQVPDFTDETARQEYVEDGYSVDCQVTDVADSMFVPPSDVKFQDMSKLMENAQQMMQQQNAYEGQGMSAEQQQQLQEQAQQMMQQYGQ